MAFNTEPHDHVATPTEASREFARNAGSERPHQAWILSHLDIWERNPFYQGPARPHPESEEAEFEQEGC